MCSQQKLGIVYHEASAFMFDMALIAAGIGQVVANFWWNKKRKSNSKYLRSLRFKKIKQYDFLIPCGKLSNKL